MAEIPEQPEIRDVPLRYRLGETPLRTIHLKLIVHPSVFLQLNCEVAPATPPEKCPTGCDGVLFQSHPILESLPIIGRIGRWIRYVPVQGDRYFVDLRGTFDEYLSLFTGKTKSTLSRKVRKFEKSAGGSIDFRCYRTSKELKTFYPLAREVSGRTYQEHLLDSGLPVDDGFRSQMLDLAERGQTRAYLLFYDGRPISYLYSSALNSVLLYKFLGFDPEFRRHSPGVVLHWLMFESLFAEGAFRYFDFTEGQGSQKKMFSTGSRYVADIYFLKASLLNQVRVWTHIRLDTFSRAVVTVLDRIGVKARVKRAVRVLSTHRAGRRP